MNPTSAIENQVGLLEDLGEPEDISSELEELLCVFVRLDLFSGFYEVNDTYPFFLVLDYPSAFNDDP